MNMRYNVYDVRYNPFRLLSPGNDWLHVFIYTFSLKPHRILMVWSMSVALYVPLVFFHYIVTVACLYLQNFNISSQNIDGVLISLACFLWYYMFLILSSRWGCLNGLQTKNYDQNVSTRITLCVCILKWREILYLSVIWWDL